MFIVFSLMSLDLCVVPWTCLLDNLLALISEIYCVLTSACLLDSSLLIVSAQGLLNLQHMDNMSKSRMLQKHFGLRRYRKIINVLPPQRLFSYNSITVTKNVLWLNLTLLISWHAICFFFLLDPQNLFFSLEVFFYSLVYSTAYCTSAPIGID